MEFILTNLCTIPADFRLHKAGSVTSDLTIDHYINQMHFNFYNESNMRYLS